MTDEVVVDSSYSPATLPFQSFLLFQRAAAIIVSLEKTDQMISHGFSSRSTISSNGRHLRRTAGQRRARERVLSTKDPEVDDWLG